MTLSDGTAKAKSAEVHKYRDGQDGPYTIDLHGFTVQAALQALEVELRILRELEPSSRGRQPRLIIVTGRGQHSGGRAPIRRAVEARLERSKLWTYSELPGGGAFEVRV